MRVALPPTEGTNSPETKPDNPPPLTKTFIPTTTAGTPHAIKNAAADARYHPPLC